MNLRFPNRAKRVPQLRREGGCCQIGWTDLAGLSMIHTTLAIRKRYAMSTDLANFRAWYVDTLNQLYPRRESGIAVLMLSFPLLERYLRQNIAVGIDGSFWVHPVLFSQRVIQAIERNFAVFSGASAARFGT